MKTLSKFFPAASFIGSLLCPIPPDKIPAEQSDQTNRTQAASETWQGLASQHACILSQVQWVPVADTMPTRQGGFFEKGKVYTGVLNSSVRSVGRYIGFDISLIIRLRRGMSLA